MRDAIALFKKHFGYTPAHMSKKYGERTGIKLKPVVCQIVDGAA